MVDLLSVRNCPFIFGEETRIKFHHSPSSYHLLLFTVILSDTFAGHWNHCRYPYFLKLM